LRARLRDRLPGLSEIVCVYENQGSLGLCSLALYPHEAKLHFSQGALSSKADPNKLLKRSGKTVASCPFEHDCGFRPP
jgi:hypothetical protein